MRCKVCNSPKVLLEYDGIIRNGGLGKYTKSNVKMYKCESCGLIWHDQLLDLETYYETAEYRDELEGTSAENDFYRLHDWENYDKFRYTGTDIFRDKNVADIGCGCGAFLDFLYGVSKNVIGIEPFETYRNVMSRKGFDTFAYAEDAKEKWSGKIDVVTSFDVIEHVEDPKQFIRDVYDLLSEEGIGIIGTPTDAPIMRELLGEIYERTQLFSTQHLYVFSEKNLEIMAKEVGFKNVKTKYFQRYGIKNFIGWIKDKKPNSEVKSSNISMTIDEAWKNELESHKISDYIVVYLRKGNC